jgi:hypothetical protein
LHGNIECGIIESALRALHPVDDARTVEIRRANSPYSDSSVGR